MDNSKVQQQQSDKARDMEAQALKGPLRDAQRWQLHDTNDRL